MIKIAKISQINHAYIILELERKTQCLDCKSRCSDGLFNFFSVRNNGNVLSVSLDNDCAQACHLDDNKKFFNGAFRVGDVVGIKFKESQLFKLALLLYGVPIALIIMFLGAGYCLFTWLNINADIGGLVGFASGVLLSKLLIQLNIFKVKPKVLFL